MKKIYLIIIGTVLSVHGYGQGWAEAVLREVEESNPALKAMAAEVRASKLENRSEALLPNPEIEFNYLWGAGNLGNRHDVRVSQAFDIPALAGLRSGKVRCLDNLALLGYKAGRQAVLLEAKQACIDLVYCNAMLSELKTHLEQSRILVSSYEKRLDAGGATVLDLNKAKIHLASVQGQASQMEVRRESLLSSLRTLGGGKDIPFDASGYDLAETLPDEFETWYSEAAKKNPMLEYVRAEVLLGQKQLAIDKASRLPELALGYMGEIGTVDKFRGVTVGLSIPLWSSANKVKQSKARMEAAESRRAAAEQQFYYNLQDQYRQAAALKAHSEMMRASLGETDSRDYLLSAQTRGEISIMDYLVEIDLYYEALEQTLAAERDYRHALAILGAVNL